MADKPETPRPVAIQVKLDEAMANGQYVNLARIFHNHTEFVLDAMFLPPQSVEARVLARLVLSPTHAKALLGALAQNIRLFEEKFGAIPTRPPGAEGGGGTILH